MTLHEAIEKLLMQAGQPMTTQQIADELNKNGWYRKKDGSAIQAFQIHGRTRNYSNIFDLNESVVTLSGQGKPAINAKNTEKPETDKLITPINLTNTKTSFAPFSNPETTILILGSLPGDKSLEINEYYGHPRNRFWKMIAEITHNDLPQNYPDKKELLLKSKIGVWDIAHKANRTGSLDSAIEEVEPNDIDNFISIHENIKVIGFNGRKAESLFDRYFKRQNGIKYLSLPSTSPANAGIGFDRMCGIWRQIISTNE